MKRYLQIKSSYGTDGLGTPSVNIYLSYCDKEPKCKGCHNKELWKDGVGYELTVNQTMQLIEKKYLEMLKVWGKCNIVIMGGEPLALINKPFVEELCRTIKTTLQTEIIVYTWRTAKEELTVGADYYVCGAYEESLKDPNYRFGSTNQILIKGGTNV